jgi:hypothetical protein
MPHPAQTAHERKLMHIRVGSVKYELVRVTGLHDQDEKLNGQCNHQDKQIEIDGELVGQTLYQVILHEVIHSMLLQIGHNDLGEEFVDPLAFQLYGFIRDNPKLMEEIAR